MNIAGWDTGNMNTSTQVFVLTGTYAAIAAGVYFFY